MRTGEEVTARGYQEREAYYRRVQGVIQSPSSGYKPAPKVYRVPHPPLERVGDRRHWVAAHP